MTLTENSIEKVIISAYHFLHRRQMGKVRELLGQLEQSPEGSVVDLAQAKTIRTLYILIQKRYSGNTELLKTAQTYQDEAKTYLEKAKEIGLEIALAQVRWDTINGYLLLDQAQNLNSFSAPSKSEQRITSFSAKE